MTSQSQQWGYRSCQALKLGFDFAQCKTESGRTEIITWVGSGPNPHESGYFWPDVESVGVIVEQI